MPDENRIGETERRVNTLFTEVALAREMISSTKEIMSEFRKQQDIIQSDLRTVIQQQDRIQVTLDYTIDQRITTHLLPVHEQIRLIREEGIIRKTQIAMWSSIGGVAGTVVFFIISTLIKALV